MNICKECRWFKRDWSWASAHGCRSPSRRIDPVDGHAFCDIEREYGPCGRAGKNWEARITWQQTAINLWHRWSTS